MTYYVNPVLGNDSNSGESPSTAFRTLTATGEDGAIVQQTVALVPNATSFYNDLYEQPSSNTLPISPIVNLSSLAGPAAQLFGIDGNNTYLYQQGYSIPAFQSLYDFQNTSAEWSITNFSGAPITFSTWSGTYNKTSGAYNPKGFTVTGDPVHHIFQSANAVYQFPQPLDLSVYDFISFYIAVINNSPTAPAGNQYGFTDDNDTDYLLNLCSDTAGLVPVCSISSDDQGSFVCNNNDPSQTFWYPQVKYIQGQGLNLTSIKSIAFFVSTGSEYGNSIYFDNLVAINYMTHWALLGNQTGESTQILWYPIRRFENPELNGNTTINIRLDVPFAPRTNITDINTQNLFPPPLTNAGAWGLVNGLFDKFSGLQNSTNLFCYHPVITNPAYTALFLPNATANTPYQILNDTQTSSPSVYVAVQGDNGPNRVGPNNILIFDNIDGTGIGGILENECNIGNLGFIRYSEQLQTDGNPQTLGNTFDNVLLGFGGIDSYGIFNNTSNTGNILNFGGLAFLDLTTDFNNGVTTSSIADQSVGFTLVDISTSSMIAFYTKINNSIKTNTLFIGAGPELDQTVIISELSGTLKPANINIQASGLTGVQLASGALGTQSNPTQVNNITSINNSGGGIIISSGQSGYNPNAGGSIININSANALANGTFGMMINAEGAQVGNLPIDEIGSPF